MTAKASTSTMKSGCERRLTPMVELVGVSRLSHPDFMVEVEAFAVIEDRP